MKQIIYLSILFLLIFSQSCVSNQKYVDTEARRLFAESEANKLRLDTMGKGKELRFVRRSNLELVDKIGTLAIDTGTLAPQLRQCKKENTVLRSIQNPTENIQALQKALAQKEAELTDREIKLNNAATFTASNNLSSEQMYQIFSQVKSKIGSFSANGVGISLKDDVVWISIPESLIFDDFGMNVNGKGVAIMVKLSDVLKEQPKLVTTLYVYSQDIELENPTFNENWNTCALRSSAMAQVFIRYGVSPFQITSAAMISRDTQKGKVEIAILGK